MSDAITIAFRLIVVFLLLVIAADMKKIKRALDFQDARITNIEAAKP